MLPNCEKGSSAVEFALIAPIFLALLGGIIVFGVYLGAAHNLRQLTSEAARASISGVSDTERASLARRQVDAALTGGALFRPGSIDIQVATDPGDATLYRVTLSFDSRNLGLPGLSGLVPLPPDLIRSSVSVRKGGL